MEQIQLLPAKCHSRQSVDALENQDRKDDRETILMLRSRILQHNLVDHVSRITAAIKSFFN